ncbi:hypothetical protein TWF281_001872 [Arthrobotrys megalospora]
MNPNSRQDDSQSRNQTPASRFSSPGSQGTTVTRFHNPPSIASPLPKEFSDRWRVVDTSLNSRSSTSDRTTGINGSPALKRKFAAIAGNILQSGSPAGTSHGQAAPIAPGPGSANRTASNSPQQLVRREVTTKSPSIPPSPLPPPLPVSKGITDSQQPTTKHRDKISLGTPSSTRVVKAKQPRPSPQTTNTPQSNPSKHSVSGLVSTQGRDGLTDGSLGPSLLVRGSEPTMPLWPLPQEEYEVEAPSVSTDTPGQGPYAEKRNQPRTSATKTYPSRNNNALPIIGPIPNCRKHPKDRQDAKDDCDSDCFEEYDPFDDVSELREALEKQEKTKNERQLPIFNGPQDEPPEKSLKSKPNESRRPYLLSETRSYFRDGNIPNLDSMIGHLLHVSFSEQEARRVWLTAYLICCRFVKEDFSIGIGITALRRFLESSECSRNEKHVTILSIASEAASYLPDRNEDDVYRYIVEVIAANNGHLLQPQTIKVMPKHKPHAETSWSSLLLARQCTEGMWIRRHPTSHAEIQAIGSQKSLRFLQPFRTFTEGSSDVIDCAWDSSGQNFALACTTYNDMYNRVGNLMLGSVDGPIKFLCGHKTRRPPNQGNAAILDPYLHSTVSSVEFSGDLLFSSGFDNTVKIWDKNDRGLRRSLAFESPIVRMKMSGVFPNTGAVCLQNGDVVIFRPHLGDADEDDACHILHANQDFLEPASALWVNGAGGRKGWVFVGYENKESDKRQPNAHLGDLKLYDAVKGVEVQEIRPGSTRQFDISLDESGSFLVAGAIVGPARGPTPDTHSFIRVYNIRESVRKTLEFSCRHRDINKVTMRYVRR